jgi:hypothetical protein
MADIGRAILRQRIQLFQELANAYPNSRIWTDEDGTIQVDSSSDSPSEQSPITKKPPRADDSHSRGVTKQPEGANVNGAQDEKQPEALSPLQYDILEALRLMNATDPEKRATGPDIASKVGGDATDQSVKTPLANLKRRGFVDSKTGRHGGSWLTSQGMDCITKLRPRQ